MVSPAICRSDHTNITAQPSLPPAHDDIVNAVPLLAPRMLPGELVNIFFLEAGVHDGQLIQRAEGQ